AAADGLEALTHGAAPSLHASLAMGTGSAPFEAFRMPRSTGDNGETAPRIRETAPRIRVIEKALIEPRGTPCEAEVSPVDLHGRSGKMRHGQVRRGAGFGRSRRTRSRTTPSFRFRACRQSPETATHGLGQDLQVPRDRPNAQPLCSQLN